MLKESVRAMTITKGILDLGANWAVSGLLASSLAVEK